MAYLIKTGHMEFLIGVDVLKINWNPNPFKTTIDIDDRDKEFFLMHIQNEMYSDLLCSLDNDMKYYNEKSLSNIHSRVEKWQQICDMSIDHIDVQRELSYLNEDHLGKTFKEIGFWFESTLKQSASSMPPNIS